MASNRRMRKCCHARRAIRNMSSKVIPTATAARMTVGNSAVFISCEKLLRTEPIHHSQIGLRAELDKAPLHSRRYGTHLEYRSPCVSGLEERSRLWREREVTTIFDCTTP